MSHTDDCNNQLGDLAGIYICLPTCLSVCWILFLIQETNGMPTGVRGQNPTFNTFLVFLDNVLNSDGVSGLLNDQVSVWKKIVL